jgi:hypothetical protein
MGFRAQGALNLRPSLLSLACLLTLGASFGIGLKVFPASQPQDVPVALTASKTLDIVPAVAVPSPAAEPERTTPERTAAAAPQVTTAAPQVTAALFDPTPMQPQALAADIQLHAIEPSPAQPPTDDPPPSASSGPAVPLVRGLSREPTSPPSGVRAPEPTRLQETSRTQDVTHVQEPVRRKPARRDVAAKRHGTEALRTVRRFGDDLQDIPMRSYTGDGKPLDIRIRPTSIQDVYYYNSWRP